MRVQRAEDMPSGGQLCVTVLENGMAMLSTHGRDPMTGRTSSVSLMFMEDGNSPRTTAALKELALAIRDDNLNEKGKS